MITTIKLRDLIKYLVGVIIAVFIAVCSTRYFLNLDYKKIDFLSLKINPNIVIKPNLLLASYEKEIDGKKLNNTRLSSKSTSRSGLTRILNMEIIVDEEDINKDVENKQENKLDENQHEEEKVEVEERVTTDIKDTYTNTYGTVTVKNLTDNINLTEAILKPDYNVSNKKNVIIYHTHTCESYTPTKENPYTATANFRTTDLNCTVVKVGRELKSNLEKYGFNVVQSEEKHDYPAYTGSYSRSLVTVEKLLEQNKGTDIVFDIHRDAEGSSSTYAPTVEINGEKVAQLMFVIGTNDGGGKHPNWQNNLKFAVKVQEKANEMYPGLFRPIIIRNSRYNQHVAKGACIIEVGATGNTLDQCILSMQCLANILEEVCK